LLTRDIKPDKIATKEPERRRLCHISDRELILLDFVRNQLNRCCQDGCEIQVTLRISEWGINWRIAK
jgi:hypothetical protein